jgi:hypothetical protein
MGMLRNSWLLVLLGVLAAVPASAQNDLARRGFWIGFAAGPGFASLDCELCGPVAATGPWEGGAGAYIAIALGGTVRNNLLLGGELSGWGRVDPDDDDVNASVGAVSFIMQYYPVRGSGLFLKGGLGVGGSTLRSPDLELETSGFVGTATVGYDIAIGRRFAISPHATILQAFAESASVDTPEGLRAGPDSPGALLIGLGFYWY